MVLAGLNALPNPVERPCARRIREQARSYQLACSRWISDHDRRSDHVVRPVAVEPNALIDQGNQEQAHYPKPTFTQVCVCVLSCDHRAQLSVALRHRRQTAEVLTSALTGNVGGGASTT